METKEGSQPVAEAAAQAVAPDSITATLLAKHSAGERLTPSEYGKLGAFAAKIKAAITGKGGKGGPVPGQAQPGLPTGNAAAVASLPQDQAQADGLPPVPADPRVVQRTTESIIKACDGLVRRKIVTEARRSGADDRTATRFDTAASVPVAAREMMVETSPDVAAALGIDPKAYPIATFIGGMGLWATNIWLCIDELKAIREQERRAAPTAPAKQAESETVPGMDPDRQRQLYNDAILRRKAGEPLPPGTPTA